jgi:hypothetical protein
MSCAARRGAHWPKRIGLRREAAMKPFWVQTLAWIAAVLVAVLLAMANPDGQGLFFGGGILPHGANAPR